MSREKKKRVSDFFAVPNHALTENVLPFKSLTVWGHDLLFCSMCGSTTYVSRTIAFATLLVLNSRAETSGLLLLELFSLAGLII